MDTYKPFSIVEEMVAWLASLGYRASGRVPKDRPDEFVTVERLSGLVEDMIDYPSVAIQTWAQSEDRAEAIGNEIRLAVLVGPRPDGIHSVKVNAGPYAHYDESTRQPRYQLVLDIACQLVKRQSKEE